MTAERNEFTLVIPKQSLYIINKNNDTQKLCKILKALVHKKDSKEANEYVYSFF